MTPDELDAIRERDVDCVPAGYTSAQAARDRRALLAEVDRLTATPYPEDDIKAERARILVAVEAQAESYHRMRHIDPHDYRLCKKAGCEAMSLVIAAIDKAD